MKSRPLILLGLALMLVVAAPVAAQQAGSDDAGSGGKSIVEQINCDVTTDINGVVGVNRACQINDFVNLFIYLSKWGMSILAILAVLMFIYGGFQFVTAGGRPSKVDEGKRVLTGTVIGTIIALVAYVIINTTVTAFSGVILTSQNPLGVVFGGNNPNNTLNGQTLAKPFSGKVQTGGSSSDSGTTIEACRLGTSTWARDCADDKLQVYCADPGPSGGLITTLQKQLTENQLCDCGAVADGCFGKKTVDCVRRFQIANNLPPTGVIDPKTKDLIQTPSSANCGATPSQDAQVSAQLPATVLAKTEGGDTKCCVVNNGAQDLYCVGSISTRACQALGGSSTAYEGACGSGDTAGRCGYCSNKTPPSQNLLTGSKCYMSVSQYWCTSNNTVGNPLYFFNNSCTGQCFTCTQTVLVSP